MQAGGGNVTAEAYYADDLDADLFREHIVEAVYVDHVFMLVDYERGAVGQVPGGHISPIGAYNADLDLVLVLDVAKCEYPPVWVGVAELFGALNTTDPISNKTRGFVKARPATAH